MCAGYCSSMLCGTFTRAGPPQLKAYTSPVFRSQILCLEAGAVNQQHPDEGSTGTQTAHSAGPVPGEAAKGEPDSPFFKFLIEMVDKTMSRVEVG